MADVYSHRFIDVQAWGTGSGPAVFACPEGYVAVLKAMGMTHGGEILPGGQASFRGHSGGALAKVAITPSLVSLPGTTIWQVSYAFVFGEAIAFTVDTDPGAWDAWASGYLLYAP